MNLLGRFARGRADGAPGDAEATPPDSLRLGPGSEQRSALLRLGLIVAAGVVAATLTGVGRTVAVVLAIVLMIMLHELGHFAMAKWAGMKVTEYFLGFGPRLWSLRRGETEYGIKAIPAGGYVRILGMTSLEEVDPADEPRSYRRAPFWRRISVAVAGSAVHLLLAFVLLWSLFAFVGVADGSKVQVQGLIPVDGRPGPAARAGMLPGDVITSVGGHPVVDSSSIGKVVGARAGRPVRLGVRRDGKNLAVWVTPAAQPASSGEPPHGFIGVQLVAATVTENPLRAAGRAVTQTASLTRQTVSAVGGLFSAHGIQGYASQVFDHSTTASPSGSARFESPVGIVRLASQAADTGFSQVLWLLVAINIFVGLFNMIPLLPLDGGHVAIAIYERIRSRRGRTYHVDAMKLLPLTYAVFMVIVLLGVTALYGDIVHPLANPFR